MRADRFALGFLAFGLCAAGALSCGEPFKMGSSSGTSTAGTGSGGSSTSSGSPIPCMNTKDCPGADVGCVVRFCDNGFCGKKLLSQPTSQIYGDCKVIKCTQEGNPYEDPDDNDFYNDGNPCTDDKCDKGQNVAVPRTNQGCGSSGMQCDSSGQCVQCLSDMQCEDGKKCTKGKCVPTTCSNGVKDGNETAPDCGGFDCNSCDEGKACNIDPDCESRNCKDKKLCVSTCTDTKPDGFETGTDCGGPVCVAQLQPCADAYGCKLARDCMSGVCKLNTCQKPSCTDGVKNGDETGIDCGGKTCGSCG